MKGVQYVPGNDWSGERLIIEDEYGNRGEVRWPRRRERGLGVLSVGDRWEDAEVVMRSSCEGLADDAACAAEFVLYLAHIAKTLDLAFAEERQECEEQAERIEGERAKRKAVEDRALQMRCEELAQYYMQMVRVQREGHKANAKGEFHVVVQREGQEDQSISRNMFLKEGNGNRWRFEADKIDKFEVKDGSRYETIKLTPMNDLRAQARQQEVTA